MCNRLVLIGGGGHCKSVLETIYAGGIYSEIVITDNSIARGSTILGSKVVGTDEELPDLYKNGFHHAFVTIGSIKDTSIRRRVYEKARGIGFIFPTIIDPSAVIATSSHIGEGIFIGKNVIVNADAKIGDLAIINTAAVIEHDCHVGEFSHISVGAILCGGVEIENDVFIGANAIIIQGIKIEANSIIGAGSVVLNNVSKYSRVVGRWRT